MVVISRMSNPGSGNAAGCFQGIDMTQHLRVLNLGAGVQSTAIYLMMIDGDISPADIAIFADVREEPKSVYEHLERLKQTGGPPIVTVTVDGNSLGDNLITGINSTGQRFVSIPTYLAMNGQNTALGRRQCTAEYKIKPIEQEIRRRMGAVGRPLEKCKSVTQVFGLSFDEPRRVERVKSQFHGRTGWSAEFPLFDEMMTREDCLKYLSKRWPHAVPRSACVFCPFHSDDEWLRIKNEDPDGWQRAIEIDRAIRLETSVCVRDMNAEQFLHRSCQPLELVELKQSPPDRQKKMNWSQMDCEGMCGV